jgi:polyhydroxyalkanoate synthesis repressor PhaR
MPGPEAPIVIKRYANRRLYDTGAARYVTADDLAGMVRMGEAFVVHDTATGEDVTRSILTLITSPITEH